MHHQRAERRHRLDHACGRSCAQFLRQRQHALAQCAFHGVAEFDRHGRIARRKEAHISPASADRRRCRQPLLSS